jgi:hypothetical protein
VFYPFAPTGDETNRVERASAVLCSARHGIRLRVERALPALLIGTLVRGGARRATLPHAQSVNLQTGAPKGTGAVVCIYPRPRAVTEGLLCPEFEQWPRYTIM